MNWDAIGAVGELLAAALVLGSIAYLALQIRHTNRHAVASTETAWMEGWNRLLGDWVNDERTISAVRNGLYSFNDLEKDEQAIFHMRVGALVNHWYLARQLSEKHLLDDSIFSECTKVILAILRTNGGLQFWERDYQLSPAGQELLEMARDRSLDDPILTEVMPWWARE